MNIRTMLVSDYEAVYDLWMSCAGMGLNDLDDSKEGIAQFLQRNPETCFVAEANNKIVGSILAGNDGRRGYIYHTAVHPEYRRQHIGSQLITTAMNALKRLGIHKVALVVFAKNKNGNDFWENEGITSATK
ncbi:GNAT family N-acetyltransferase [Treponema vincentii]|uniref:GNAT family N-acetyltransferase n=1 Tax=Treponema vincentii TaxID=69710 RepID=UPI0035F581EE